jgi:hypothetical protein
VEDRYLNHVARVRGGDEFSGMIAGESANSITLVSPAGVRETILRADLESLTSTRLSLMPEGFEQFLQPHDIADLIAHMEASATPPRRFAGNNPEPVVAGTDGALRLAASNAEIHGEGIVFETQYGNLGSWNGAEARAAWTVQVPATGVYDVWIQWACHDNEAGDTFRFQIGGQTLSAKVPGTGTWDVYRAEKFGQVELSSGALRAVFQAGPGLRSYLIDLEQICLVPAGVGKPRFREVGLTR